MSSYSNLGIGVGYIYVTDPDGTTIRYNVPNDKQGARMVKSLGIQAANLATNISAHGSFTVDTPTGSGNITQVSVNGVKQNTSNISFTIASTPSDIAKSVIADINSTTPASGVNYTAIDIGDIVYLVAPASAGDSVNGHAVSVSISANLTVSDVEDIDGGSDANATSYNSSFGFRFFLDATSDAEPGTIGAAATEISDYLCRTLDAGFPIVTATISSGAITVERIAPIMYVLLAGEGGVADTLTTINPVGFANGDQLILVGASSGVAITIDNSGNITTQNTTSFTTGDFSNVLTVALSATEWYEKSKSTTAVPTAAQFRTANFPLLSTSGYGSAALTAADNTTVTLTANSNKQKQVVTGTVSLSTGNYEIAISTTDAKAGDEFIIEYNAAVTVGSYDVIIGGVTLADADALTGGIVVMAYYSGSAWQYTMYKNYNDGARVQTADIASGAVTVAKLETGLKYETIVVPVSFSNPAENRIKWAYSGTVVGLTAYSTSLIGDNSTITPKNNVGAIMGSGILTFNSGDPVDTGVTSTPATNNTFVSGDVFSLLTQTSTLGSGTALVTVTILRS